MNDTKSKDGVFDPTIPEHELRLECSIRIWGREVEIINIKPTMSYSSGLHPSLSRAAANNVAQVLEMLILQPVQVMLRRRENELFDEEAREMAARIKEGAVAKANPIFAPDPGTQFNPLSPDFTEPFEDDGLGFAQMPSPDFGPPLPAAEPVRPVKASRSSGRAPRQPARPPMEEAVEAAERSRAA